MENRSNIKKYITPFLFIFLVYVFSMLSIWRSGVSFIDDIGRSVDGHAWGSTDFNRYSSSILSYILNVGFSLYDISPLPQLIAMVFLSISSMILVYIFYGNIKKYTALLLSTFVGLTPFLIECWLYKFDSPCIALSILVSIIPFLFWEHILDTKKNSIIQEICIFISLLVMWTSYQASSGIYLVILVGIIARDFIYYHRSWKELIKKIFVFMLPYMLSALFFKFCLPPAVGYKTTEVFSANNLVSGIFNNVIIYLKYLKNSLNRVWLVLIVFIAFNSVIAACFKEKGLRIKYLLGIGCFLIISLPLSLGVYIFLDNLAINNRTCCATGVVLSILCLLMIRGIPQKRAMRLLVIPNLTFLYSSIVFLFALGNAMADQEKYEYFMEETLLTELSSIYTDKTSVSDKSLTIEGDIGPSAVTEHLYNGYPIAEKILYRHGLQGNGWMWGSYKLLQYYGWEQEFNTTSNCEQMTVKKTSYYYDIGEIDDNIVCIRIK